MENFINSVGIEKIILFVLIFNVVLLIGFIINIIKTNAISKKYKNFMQKLGEGKNIEEDLENYMYKVERVEKQNIEIAKFIEQLDKDFEKMNKIIKLKIKLTNSPTYFSIFPNQAFEKFVFHKIF